jgi:hypothetical protein
MLLLQVFWMVCASAVMSEETKVIVGTLVCWFFICGGCIESDGSGNEEVKDVEGGNPSLLKNTFPTD